MPKKKVTKGEGKSSDLEELGQENGAHDLYNKRGESKNEKIDLDNLNKDEDSIVKDKSYGQLMSAVKVNTNLLGEQNYLYNKMMYDMSKAEIDDRFSKRLQSGNLFLKELNDWKDDITIGLKIGPKIVNVIPRLFIMESEVYNKLRDQEISTLLGDVSKIPILRNSMEVFGSGTICVRYILDSQDLPEKIEYKTNEWIDPELRIEALVLAPDQNTNPLNRTRVEVFSGLVDLILKLRKSGDVFIQNINTTMISDIYPGFNQPLSILSSKNLPDVTNPHIYLSTYGHTLDWYKKEIGDLFRDEEIILGECGGTEIVLGVKKSSYFGTTTDSLFAHFYQLHMEEHDSKKLDLWKFNEIIQVMKPIGSTIVIEDDNKINVYDVEFLDKYDSDSYAFLFILMPKFRSVQYAYLKNFLEEMRGLRVSQIESTIRKMNIGLSDQLNMFGDFQEILLSKVRGLNISHFYEMMVMERCHAFLDFKYNLPDTVLTIEDAILYLLMIAIEALMFPNLFWTNLNLFSCLIYRCWRMLSASDYKKMVATGYTNNIKEVRVLTKTEIRNGEIPKIFNPRNPITPNRVKEYISHLNPIGVKTSVRTSKFEWDPNIIRNSIFYIPFTFISKQKMLFSQETPFYDRIMTLIRLLQKLARDSDNAKQKVQGSLAVLNQFLEGISQTGRDFGSVAHYELHILYKELISGPEIIYSTYMGKSEPNQAFRIGLASSLRLNQNGLPGVDLNQTYHFGIGILTIMTISGDTQFLNIDSKFKDSILFQFKNPINRLYRHVAFCQKISEISNAFGVFNYFLDVSEDVESPFSSLLRIFGPNLKSGVGNQILSWLLKNVDINDLTGFELSLEHSFSPDRRYKNPMITKMDDFGNIIVNEPNDLSKLNKQLLLLNIYEKRKLEAAIQVVIGVDSPIHKYGKGIIIARSVFEFFSPKNRHDYPKYYIIFDQETNYPFEIIRDGELNSCYFIFNDRIYKSPIQKGFPNRVQIQIENPSGVPYYVWEYIKMAINEAKWQVYFNEIYYMANILTSSSDIASNVANNWSFLEKVQIGTVVPINLYDTTQEIPTLLDRIKPNLITQYICVISEVDRNIIVKGIVGQNKSQRYEPPDVSMWTIGKFILNATPRTKNGVERIFSNKIGFNNVVKVWTKYVKFDQFPTVTFKPPNEIIENNYIAFE